MHVCTHTHTHLMTITNVEVSELFTTSETSHTHISYIVTSLTRQLSAGRQ